MSSDIQLDGDIVRIKGKLLVSETWDIHLDAPDRRGDTPGSRYRRALVHNPDDGLTINWANDYSSGVTVEGPTKMNGHVRFSETPTVPDLRLTLLPAERGRPQITRPPSSSPGLPGSGVRLPGNAFPGVRLPGVSPGVDLTEALQPGPSSLVRIIKDLREEIEALKTRLEALE